MNVSVRVQPGASRTSVGGRYGDSEPPVLVVRVHARPIDGQANEAVVVALAEAFGVRKSSIALLSGATARTKLFRVDGISEEQLQQLLD